MLLREKVADPDVQLVCDPTNLFKWTALIKVCFIVSHRIVQDSCLTDEIILAFDGGVFCRGHRRLLFDGGVFQIAFTVPEQYPLQPPKVRFLTKIFHPNVHFKVFNVFPYTFSL